MRRLLFALPIAFLLAPFVASSQQPPDTLPGFDSKGAESQGEIDDVSLYSGDPHVVIPIGPSYPVGPGQSWQVLLSYSAKFWNLCQQVCPVGDPDKALTYGTLTGDPSAGLGWSLSPGHIAASPDSGESQLRYFYQEPDGTRHSFRNGSLISQDKYRLSEDHRRVDFPDGRYALFEQEQPQAEPVSGVPTSDFKDWSTCQLARPTRRGMTKLYSSFGQLLVEIVYAAASSTTNQAAREVTEIRLGGSPSRAIKVFWGQAGVDPWRVITRVELPATGGTVLTATLAYTSLAFERNDEAHNPPTAPPFLSCAPFSVTAPILASVTFTGQGLLSPDRAFTFDYDSTGSGITAGTLTRVTLPTGGTVSYTYSKTSDGRKMGLACLRGSCRDPETDTEDSALPTAPASNLPATRYRPHWDRSPGVATRTAFDPYTLISSETRYARRDYWYEPVLDQVDEFRTVRRVLVWRPSGNGSTQNAQRHLFFVGEGLDDTAGSAISSRSYDGSDITSTPIRTEVSCYEDGLLNWRCGYWDDATSKPLSLGFDERRKVQATTWFGQAPSTSAADCEQGVWPAPVPCRRISFTSWDEAAGEYARSVVHSSFSNHDGWGGRQTNRTLSPQVGVHWLPKLVSEQRVTDFTAPAVAEEGPFSTVTKFTLDTNTGFVTDIQIPEIPEQESPNSSTLSRSFTPDGYGNVLSMTVKGIGGSRLTTTSFRDDWTYQDGPGYSPTGLPWNRRRSGFLWDSFAVTRDPATGLVTQSRDPNGIETSYSYDALGRLTRITPPAGQHPTFICYLPHAGSLNGSGTGNPAVQVIQAASWNCATGQMTRPFGNNDGDALAGYQYDGFGRLSLEERKVPTTEDATDGLFAPRRFTKYDAAGHVVSVSEWAKGRTDGTLNTTGPLTIYSSFDPFGRPRVITRQDGTSTTSQVTVSYTDDSTTPPVAHSDTLETITVSGINGLSSSNVSLTRKTRRDMLGRVLSISETPSSGAGTAASASYRYNVLDKLVKVTQGSQTRSFEYDGFGFLKKEKHPEWGTNAATYSKYDALGNPLEETLPDTTAVTRAFDALGRLKTVTAGGRVFVENTYDVSQGLEAGTDRYLGRLTQQIGRDKDLPANGGGEVTTRFSFTDLAGRLTAKDVTVNDRGIQDTFREAWRYDATGKVSIYSPPSLTSRGFDQAADRAYVYFDYAWGFPVGLRLNGIPIARGGTYDYAGRLSSYINTFGGTVDIPEAKFEIQRDGWGRPVAFRLDGTGPLFNSGAYTYDQADNITAIGPDTYFYDGHSRLLRKSIPSGGGKPLAAINLDYSYDDYGNLTKNSRKNLSWALPTDTATNRLQTAGVVYGDRGNLRILPALAGEPAQTLTWDVRDRISQLDRSGETYRYLYDGMDERVLKRIVSSKSSWYTLRDGQNRVVSEYFGRDPGTNTGYENPQYGPRLARRNFFLGSQLVLTLGQPGLDGETNSFQIPATDHLGSTRAVFNRGLTQISTHKYTPYGEQEASDTTRQRMKFAGMESENEEGAKRYYDHARSHDAIVGRFLSTDIVLGKVESPLSWNRYTYARNNPLKYVDPDGNLSYHAGIAAGFADSRSRLAAAGEDRRELRWLLSSRILGSNWGSGAYWGDVARAGLGALWNGAVGLGAHPSSQVLAGSMALESSAAGSARQFTKFVGGGKGITGELDTAGVVRFAVEAGEGSAVRGGDLFREMMSRFGSAAKVVEGNWMYGDNLAALNKLTGSGMSLEAAAAQTWTGRRAAELGYSTVRIVSAEGGVGNYTRVTVQFSK